MANINKYAIGQVLDSSQKSYIIGDISTVPGLSQTIGDNITGLEGYGLRAAVLARKGDILFVPAETQELYGSNWKNHLERNGLNGSKILGVGGSGNLSRRIASNDELRNFSSGGLVLPYYAGSDEFSAAKHLEGKLVGPRQDISNMYNDKTNLRRVLESLGTYPLTAGGIYEENSGYDMLKSLVERTISSSSHNKVFIRRGLGASGYGQYLIDGSNNTNIYNQLKAVYDEIETSGGDYLVEEFLNVSNSPSVIAFIDESKIIPLAQTTQVLHDRKHAGNLIDLTEDQNYIRFAMPLLENMFENGYYGQVGIDFINTDKGLYICEVNARGTGAFFPASVLYRINTGVGNDSMKVVMSDTIKISAPEDINSYYDKLERAKLEPKDNGGVGIIEINPAKLLHADEKGKVSSQIAIVGKNRNDIKDFREKYVEAFS